MSDRQGMLTACGLRFVPATGRPVGEPFRVTSFASLRLTISPELPRMQIAVTSTQLVLPITETAGELWLLDNVNR